jgi:hypothetical protein
MNCCIVSGENELKSRFENAFVADGDAGGREVKRFGDVRELNPEFVRVSAFVGGGSCAGSEEL